MLEEEKLPFLTHFNQFRPAPATNPNPKRRIQLKTSLLKILLRVFFFCTVFPKYSLNQPAFCLLRLRDPYLLSADKGRSTELSGQKKNQTTSFTFHKTL